MTSTQGNDPELDPDREPEPPTKAIDKPVQRAGKRNAGAEGPARGDAPRPAGGGRGGRHEVFTRSDQGTFGQTARRCFGWRRTRGHVLRKAMRDGMGYELT